MVCNGLVDCDGMWAGPVGADAADGAMKYGGGKALAL